MQVKLCAATGCRTIVPNGRRRCHDHDQRLAYRSPAYKRIRASMLAYGASCAECGTTDDLTVDHIVPLSAGGTNDPSNLQVLCRNCNSRKGALV